MSIFIAGSNSDLLSGELATHIAGRYVSFNVYPFTFKEMCEFKNIEDNYPKYVLSMDKFDFSQNGIIHKNVIDWLLEE